MKTLTFSTSLGIEKVSRQTSRLDFGPLRSELMAIAIFGGLCGIAGVALGAAHLLGLSGAYQFVDNLSAGFLVLAFLLLSFAAHGIKRREGWKHR